MHKLGGLADLTDEELTPLRAAAEGPDDYRAWMETGDLLSRRQGIFFYPLAEQYRMPKTHGHDATDVPLFAQGPGAERYAGVLDNDGILPRILAILGRTETRHVGRR